MRHCLVYSSVDIYTEKCEPPNFHCINVLGFRKFALSCFKKFALSCLGSNVRFLFADMSSS